MANIELIKVLRERTGAGIMDCKKALSECNDDVDKACDWLREKGIAKQAKKADRIAAEGLTNIAVSAETNSASVVEVNCETDFVAKATPFIDLVNVCAKKALVAKDINDLQELVKEEFTDAAVKLGEKLSIRRFNVVKGTSENSFGTYSHGGGKISTIVLLKNKDDELAKQLAMHITANNPKYISENDIAPEEIENETKVQLEAMKNDEKLKGKKEEQLKMIVKGKVHKVFAEFILLEQDFLMDPSKTVAQVLKEKGNEVLTFVRYQVGEGLEKRKDNFAEEVMAQAK